MHPLAPFLPLCVTLPPCTTLRRATTAGDHHRRGSDRYCTSTTTLAKHPHLHTHETHGLIRPCTHTRTSPHHRGIFGKPPPPPRSLLVQLVTSNGPRMTYRAPSALSPLAWEHHVADMPSSSEPTTSPLLRHCTRAIDPMTSVLSIPLCHVEPSRMASPLPHPS
jgi:hypothetical protein